MTRIWRLTPARRARENERSTMRSCESFTTARATAALAAVLSLSIVAVAQNAGTGEQTSERVNAAITERYMTNIQTELISKIDTKSAAVGQEVTARTKDAATLADGTALPKGTKLVGRVVQVAAQTKDQPVAMLAITFDRAQMKDGSSVALRSAIRTVAPPAGNSSGANAFSAAGPVRGSGSPVGGGMGGGGMGDDPMGTGGIGGGPVSGGPMGTGGMGGGSPASPTGGSSTTGTRGGGGLGDGQGGLGGSLPGQTTRTIGQRTNIAPNLGPPGGAGTMPVTKAGETTSTAPRATALPGVMLTNSAGTGVSGVLIASGQNILLNSGTQMTLGVISNQPRPAP
jgi:hypothetical protein